MPWGATVRPRKGPRGAYTVREVATATGLAERTVLDALRSGRLPGVKTSAGGRWRIMPADLGGWLKASRSVTLG